MVTEATACAAVLLTFLLRLNLLFLSTIVTMAYLRFLPMMILIAQIPIGSADQTFDQ